MSFSLHHWVPRSCNRAAVEDECTQTCNTKADHENYKHPKSALPSCLLYCRPPKNSLIVPHKNLLYLLKVANLINNKAIDTLTEFVPRTNNCDLKNEMCRYSLKSAGGIVFKCRPHPCPDWRMLQTMLPIAKSYFHSVLVSENTCMVDSIGSRNPYQCENHNIVIRSKRFDDSYSHIYSQNHHQDSQ